MPEHQNEEWKESWKDEYLRWICGFANAQGGRIYIGMNDAGQVVGVPDYARLMEDIPNKVVQTLGIIVDVNLLEENGLFYIEINVAPTSFAVNYKGEYHYRSGSTRQQLKGTALSEFLLRKTGRQVRWDAEAEPCFSIESLDYESFELFRKAARYSGRVSEDDLKVDNRELLERLNLLTPQGYLKRAAVLLFHRTPERLVSGCYVKIGKFGKGADLQFQEEVRGSLFVIADRLLEIIYLKYLKAVISYEGIIRVERYPYPREALREIIFNALIHSNWAADEPIQIKITNDSLCISNVCVLPPGWTRDSLLSTHKSKPYNPNIANAFFRAGYVEAWGRGIEKVRDICDKYGCPPPTYEILGEDINVIFRPVAPCSGLSPEPPAEQGTKNAKDLNTQYKDGDELKARIIETISFNPEISLAEIATRFGISKSAVRHQVSQLTKAKKLIRIGSPRKGRWSVISPES